MWSSPKSKNCNVGLSTKLLHDKYVLANFGYGGAHIVHESNGDAKISSALLGRHETINRYMK